MTSLLQSMCISHNTDFQTDSYDMKAVTKDKA